MLLYPDDDEDWSWRMKDAVCDFGYWFEELDDPEARPWTTQEEDYRLEMIAMCSTSSFTSGGFRRERLVQSNPL